MTRSRAFATLLIATGLHVEQAVAQAVTLDEGTFTIFLNGRDAGTETFRIRRSASGSEASVIADAVVRVDRGSGATESKPILEALLPGGAASAYQIKITGAESSELRLTPQGRRFLAFIRTESGEEEREFMARPETHIIEDGVAHQYYFLGSVAEGSTTPIIEPRTRRQFQLTASASTDETRTLGATAVPARKVTFTTGTDARTVWFDRQGRVLRVEIPSAGYVAERRDLVG
jgi:hypothetical protein